MTGTGSGTTTVETGSTVPDDATPDDATPDDATPDDATPDDATPDDAAQPSSDEAPTGGSLSTYCPDCRGQGTRYEPRAIQRSDATFGSVMVPVCCPSCRGRGSWPGVAPLV